MNLDKTIKELTNRLDEVYPASNTTNGGISHGGINYWKGKKIISAKDWNELYEKSSIHTNAYTTILTSRKPLQYFPDDYNGSIPSLEVIDELKEEAQKWNKEYYELLEYRKNPILGRMKCSRCLLSGSNDDPIFVGMEKVFARIITNQCNNNNNNNNNVTNTNFYNLITYHCNVMNIFSCPFESIKSLNEKEIESKDQYKREDLFALQRLAFAIEQAISTFFEITKDNEIIYEVDFVNDRVQENHTKYNGEPERWEWNDNVKEILSKVKPISKIVIRDEHDIYSILTNREKLECLLQEYEKKNHKLEKQEGEQQVCCDEITPCVLDEKYNSNNEKASTTTTETLDATEKNQQLQKQVRIRQDKQNDSHKGENRHSKKTEGEKVNNENLKPALKSKIKEEVEKSDKEQQILLKENKRTIIDFLLENKDSIRVEDLKIYEPLYKCYRQKGNCHICNSISNIICINCNNSHNHYKKVWLCTNHWEPHVIDNHNLQ
jgi:hypothetical protein